MPRTDLVWARPRPGHESLHFYDVCEEKCLRVFLRPTNRSIFTTCTKVLMIPGPAVGKSSRRSVTSPTYEIEPPPLTPLLLPREEGGSRGVALSNCRDSWPGRGRAQTRSGLGISQPCCHSKKTQFCDNELSFIRRKRYSGEHGGVAVLSDSPMLPRMTFPSKKTPFCDNGTSFLRITLCS